MSFVTKIVFEALLIDLSCHKPFIKIFVAWLYLALDIPPDNSHSFIATSYKLTSL